MKKDIEGIKTITLTFLVIVSLVLTWGLWTYQPQYDYVQDTSYVQNIQIGNTKENKEIIRPTQLILHENDKKFGTMDQQQMNLLLQLLNKAEFVGGIVENNEVTRSSLETIVDFGQTMELIYPAPIPVKVFQTLFDSDDGEIPLKQIDRIIIPLITEPETSPSVYLFSDDEKVLVKIKMVHVDYEQLQAYFKENVKTFYSYKYVTVPGDLLFYPEVKVKLPEITYSMQQLSIEQFKNALFTDPNIVNQYSSKSDEESYTDGARALEVFYQKNRFRFINPSPDVFNMEPDEIILSSIEYVNDHAGWTDQYILHDWSADEQSTRFRTVVSGYPVFDLRNEGSASIIQSWRNHEIYEYSRSLINLRFAISSPRKMFTLPSGDELINYVKNTNARFDISKLEALTIGYGMVKDANNNVVVTFLPSWFMKYDGKWEKITVIQGEDVNGLE